MAIRGIVRRAGRLDWIALVAMLAVFAGLHLRDRSTCCRRCRAASSRRSTRAMPSSSCSCRTAPRCRAPTRSMQRPREIIQKTPGVARCRRLRRLLRRDLHQRHAMPASIFARVQAVRRAARRPASRPARSSATLFGRLQSIQEAFIIAHAAAAGARHRQCRRLQDAAAGAQQRRRAPDPGAGLRDRSARPTRRRAWPACSPPSRHRARRFFLEIDRDKARMLNVPIPNIFETLSINLGTAYVNDFNAFGRVYQVRAQADQALPRRPRRHPAAEGALGDRRAGAARHAGRDPRRHRARRSCSATTCTSRCRCRATPRPAFRRATALDAMEGLAGEDAAAGHVLRVDRARLQERQTGNTAVYHLRPVGAVRVPGAGGAI